MAQLTGIVNSMNVVEGDYQEGKRKGQHWEFISLTIADEDSGFVWSCQIPQEDEQYEKLKSNNLVRHNVRVTVLSQTASERELPNGNKVMQIRSKVTELEDLGKRVTRAA